MLVYVLQFGGSHFVVVSIELVSNPSHKRKLPGQSVPDATQLPPPVHVMPVPHETGLPH
jgi:hypothetical protein